MRTQERDLKKFFLKKCTWEKNRLTNEVEAPRHKKYIKHSLIISSIVELIEIK